jgi:hypothetical protein
LSDCIDELACDRWAAQGSFSEPSKAENWMPGSSTAGRSNSAAG